MSLHSFLSTLFPPTFERWQLLKTIFTYFPVVSVIQWISPWQPQGKTSISSLLNLPGKLAWCIMELPGPINMAYIMSTLPSKISSEPLPLRNYLLAGLYILHYANRAVITPLFLADSFSPIHTIIFLSAVCFNYMNSTVIGGWLAGYGMEDARQDGNSWQIGIGLVIFMAGMAGNILAEGHLRQIRREAVEKQASQAKSKGNSGSGKYDKVYKLPDAKNLFFSWALYPHYTLEWIEWIGYWIIGGFGFTPALIFVVNEVSAMTPRAVWGRRWYVEKFGKKDVGDNRGAVLPRMWGIG